MMSLKRAVAAGRAVVSRLLVPPVTVLLLWSAPASATDAPTLSASDTTPEEVVTIKIRARSFEPPSVTLHANRKTRLVFENLDAELHAFVPDGLLAGVNLNITGNGAPEFGADGFKRIIIPSNGRAELRFVPERAGTFPYRCDMPGHEMKATIVVE